MTTLDDLLPQIRARGRITAEDVLAIRGVVYAADATISRAEAEDLLTLDEKVEAHCPEWTALLAEALCDHVVRQQQPEGYVDEATAAWLIEAISHDKRVRTDTELEVLAHVLETAVSAPRSLVLYALEQVKEIVLTGQGPFARGGAAEPGRVSAGEAAMLKRILYAAGGESGIGVTREEAEILFDINDASRGADNDPAWTDLFSRALAASVLAASGYEPASREDALRRELWLQTPEPGFAGVLGRSFTALFRPRETFAQASANDEDFSQADRMEARIAAAAPLTADEALWLRDRILRDGEVDASERALLAFLRNECPDLHPALAALVDGAPQKQVA